MGSNVNACSTLYHAIESVAGRRTRGGRWCGKKFFAIAGFVRKTFHLKTLCDFFEGKDYAATDVLKK